MKKLFYALTVLFLLFSCQEVIYQPNEEKIDLTELQTRLTTARASPITSSHVAKVLTLAH